MMVREASDAGKDNARERLRTFVESVLKVSGITGETNFRGDLGVDSMQLVVLLLAIEREFKITIPDHGLMAAGSTFGSLADFVLPLMDVNSHGQPG